MKQIRVEVNSIDGTRIQKLNETKRTSTPWKILKGNDTNVGSGENLELVNCLDHARLCNLKDESIRGDVLKGIDRILSDLQAKENR